VWHAVTAGAPVVVGATEMTPIDESRVRMRATVRVGAATWTAETDAAVTVEGDLWKARGRLDLDAGAGGPLTVEYDLVAVASAPT
jgi:membrane protein implicated in regulation of membrane protease activity